MKTQHWIVLAMLVLGLGAGATALVRAQTISYRIRATHAASGGGVSASASYQVHGTLGQPDVASSSGATYTVSSGLWRGAARGQTVYLPLVLRAHSGEVPDDVPDSCPGYAIGVGQEVREDFDHQYDKDWYSVNLSSGVTYGVQTYDLESGSVDTILFLFTNGCPASEIPGDVYCPSGGNVCKRISTDAVVGNCVCDDDCGGNPAAGSCFDWQATSSGRFDVFVRNYYWNTEWGNDTHYTLRITQGGGAAAQALGGDPASAKPAPPAEP